jgi:sialate O-acetylesterase
LQAPQVARLWGWTKSAHERVRVSFNGQNYDVTSGSDRKWVHALPATPAGGPHSILVTSIEG